MSSGCSALTGIAGKDVCDVKVNKDRRGLELTGNHQRKRKTLRQDSRNQFFSSLTLVTLGRAPDHSGFQFPTGRDRLTLCGLVGYFLLCGAAESHVVIKPTPMWTSDLA